MDSPVGQGMIVSNENNSLKSALLLTKIGCLLVIILSDIVIFGWIINVGIFKSILPGFLGMNPLEAIGFIALSIIILLRLNQTELTTKRLLTINTLSFFVFLIGLTTLLFNFFGVGIGSDRILFSKEVGNSVISVISSINFIFLSIALTSYRKLFVKDFGLVQFLTLAVGLITMFAGIGFLYHVLSFYQIYSTIPMQLNTIGAYAVVCFATLFSTQGHGMMKVLTADLDVSAFSRKLLATAVLLPIILGAIHVYLNKVADIQTAIALSVIFQIVLFTTVIWIMTKAIYKSAYQRNILLHQISDKNEKLDIANKELAHKIIELDQANTQIRDLLNHQQKMRDIVSENR